MQHRSLAAQKEGKREMRKNGASWPSQVAPKTSPAWHSSHSCAALLAPTMVAAATVCAAAPGALWRAVASLARPTARPAASTLRTAPAEPPPRFASAPTAPARCPRTACTDPRWRWHRLGQLRCAEGVAAPPPLPLGARALLSPPPHRASRAPISQPRASSRKSTRSSTSTTEVRLGSTHAHSGSANVALQAAPCARRW